MSYMHTRSRSTVVPGIRNEVCMTYTSDIRTQTNFAITIGKPDGMDLLQLCNYLINLLVTVDGTR